VVPLVLAFVVALVGAFVYQRYAPLDVPNERSSHSRPIPSGGGVAIVLGFAVGLAAWLANGNSLSPRAWGWLAGALLVASISFADDLRPLPATPRLAAHAAGALLLTLAGIQQRELPLVLALPLAFLWVALVTNVYNFMDGIDGLAASQAIIAGAALALAGAIVSNPLVSIGGGLIAAASAGFLPHNLPPARLFMGDVGSTFLGFNFAGLSLLGNLGVGGGRLPIEFGVVVLAPFLFDGIVTLTRRIARGERWYAAHRSHYYQRLITHGLSHAQVTALYAALALIAAAAALLGLVLEEPLRQALAVVAFLPMLLVVGWVWRLDASHVVTPGRSS
jgi:UDP-N-acetylmuramyl pentapeptide phosphotransferase/UDP-N-acetylglucosamine-1-phosphate transferase